MYSLTIIVYNEKSPFKEQAISGAATTFTSTSSTTSSNSVANINMHQLSTTNQGSNLYNGKGIMFSIYAKQDVVIRGFDIKAKRKSGGSRVEIFTLDSDYEGQPIKTNEWKLLYDGILPIQRRKVFKLADFEEKLIIPAGMTQSFYIYTEKGLMYSASEAEGEVYGNDGVITIRKGSVTMRKFMDETVMGLWLGVVRYNINTEP